MADEVQPLPIQVVDYDSAWTEQFANEVAALSRDVPLNFYHIGSTSVPGCAAKPIIDIMAEAESMGLYRAEVRQSLTGEHGYTSHGEYGVEGRDFLTKYGSTKFNMSVFGRGDPNIARNLAIREKLASDPAFRKEYVRLKRELAARHSHDLAAYNDAKSALIRAVLGETME